MNKVLPDTSTKTQNSLQDNANRANGYVYVMAHSLFSDVVKIGSTDHEPHRYAQTLSETVPGHYKVEFAQQCNNPYKIQQQVRDYLKANACVNEFYEVPAQVATNLIKREMLRIPVTSV